MTNFDSCDFYSCDPDAEQLDFSDPEEALDAIVESPVSEWISENSPVTVHGWRRRPLAQADIDHVFERLLSAAVEELDEECGDPEGDHEPLSPDDFERVLTEMGSAKLILADLWSSWACDQVAKREYSAEELREVFADEIAEESGQ
jgi:hypothetical protein